MRLGTEDEIQGTEDGRQGTETENRDLKPPLWALVHTTTYAPMIYPSLCVMLLMRAASITWASLRGLGPENLEFLGPKYHIYRLSSLYFAVLFIGKL